MTCNIMELHTLTRQIDIKQNNTEHNDKLHIDKITELCIKAFGITKLIITAFWLNCNRMPPFQHLCSGSVSLC
jgi:hypothetical protein